MFVAPALLLLQLAVRPAGAVEYGPQGIVRQFCRADGLGARLTVATWQRLAPLVTWPLEPAWDHVVLITGYTVYSPRPSENGALAVEVRYEVVGQLSVLGLDTAVHAETIAFRVHAPDEAGWRIIGPPPPPHVFANRVDIATMRRALAHGGRGFVANTIFVWKMLRAAEWDVGFEGTLDLLSGATYRPVDQPTAGDLVVYLRSGTPYHVGFLEADDRIVSSTLNAGIVRTAIDAFPGEIRYLRLLEPQPNAAVAGTGGPAPAWSRVRPPGTPALAVRKRTAPSNTAAPPATFTHQPR